MAEVKQLDLSALNHTSAPYFGIYLNTVTKKKPKPNNNKTIKENKNIFKSPTTPTVQRVLYSGKKKKKKGSLRDAKYPEV